MTDQPQFQPPTEPDPTSPPLAPPSSPLLGEGPPPGLGGTAFTGGPATATPVGNEPPAKSSGWKAWVAAGVVAAVVAGGAAVAVGNGNSKKDSVAATAQANGTSNGQNGQGTGQEGQGQGSFRRNGASGKITKITDEAITVTGTDRNGDETTYTVKTTDETTYTETVEGKLADIAKGDTVTAIIDETSGNASQIVDNGVETASKNGQGGNGQMPEGTPPTGGQAPGGDAEGATPPSPPSGSEQGQGGAQNNGRQFARGTVTSISGSKITIETRDGSTTEINTDSNTKVYVTKKISRSDLKVGDSISAMGALSDTTVTAQTIRRSDADLAEGGFGGGPGGFGGGPGGMGGGPGGFGGGPGGDGTGTQGSGTASGSTATRGA